MLDAYFAAGRGKVRFEFVDPGKQISAENEAPHEAPGRDVFGRTVRAPTAMERELEGRGIVPVQVRVNEADKVEVKRAFMGLALEMGDKREVIPVITDTQGLEYDLTTLIRKMARHDTQRLGVLQPEDGVDTQEAMGQALAALSQMYTIVPVRPEAITPEASPLADLDALLVVGPKSALPTHVLAALREFIAAGHAVGIFAGPVQSDLRTLQVTDNSAGLDTLFADLGVKVAPGLVLDASCATLNVQQQAGFMRVAQPVNYPYIGQSMHLQGSNVTTGLDKVLLPFMGPVEVAERLPAGVTAEVWLRSSDKSWVQPPPFDLNPMQRWLPEAASMAPRPLVVALRGPLLRPVGEAAAEARVPEGRVIVAGGHDLLLDAYLQKPNEALLLNMADWLMHDDDLLAVRTRGLAPAPLAPAGASKRQAIKLGNIVGLPLAFVALGLARWRRREARRQGVVFALSPAASESL
jgi:ABC-type uncharacterized transport system involved in gliding motility auxiliary subunit